jgi:Domain of unknown function (DUF4166)
MRMPLFHRAYGEALATLPDAIVRVHDIGTGKTWRGTATITTGNVLLARMIGVIAGFPPAADAVKLTVEMTPDGTGEVWRRRFGDFSLDTRLRPGKAHDTIEETLGAVTAILRLVPDRTGVQQVPVGFRMFGVPVPRKLWPRLDVRESAEGGRYAFKVAMWQFGMLIQRYEGWLDANGV